MPRTMMLLACLALSACANREEVGQRMAQRYDIPVEAALFVGDQCPMGDYSLARSLNGCRRVAARHWNEAHPDRQISTALDLDGGGGTAFVFVPAR